MAAHGQNTLKQALESPAGGNRLAKFFRSLGLSETGEDL
jgi:hypothetical protein